MKLLSKKESVSRYRKIAKRLKKLDVAACRHISRQDNNQMFEIRFFIEAVADRIENGYPESDYPRLLK